MSTLYYKARIKAQKPVAKETGPRLSNLVGTDQHSQQQLHLVLRHLTARTPWGQRCGVSFMSACTTRSCIPSDKRIHLRSWLSTGLLQFFSHPILRHFFPVPAYQALLRSTSWHAICTRQWNGFQLWADGHSLRQLLQGFLWKQRFVRNDFIYINLDTAFLKPCVCISCCKGQCSHSIGRHAAQIAGDSHRLWTAGRLISTDYALCHRYPRCWQKRARWSWRSTSVRGRRFPISKCQMTNHGLMTVCTLLFLRWYPQSNLQRASSRLFSGRTSQSCSFKWGGQILVTQWH